MEKRSRSHNSSSSSDQPVDPKHDFYAYFGKDLAHIYRYFRHEVKFYQRTSAHFKCKPLPAYFQSVNEHLSKYILCWPELNSYCEGRICFHVYKMFYSLMRDPEFNKLSKYDRNVLLWAVLLHDCCKLGTPVIQGKDPIHPFKSAKITLHYFNDVFNFVNLTKEDLAEWDEIFSHGYTVKKKVYISQNHAIVPKIKEFLDSKLEGKDFEKEVIYYVLLHQSVPTLNEHPHASLLEPLETEVPKYFDARTFKLFRFFLIHDSFSYLLYNREVRESFGKQINENYEKLRAHVENIVNRINFDRVEAKIDKELEKIPV